jgi:hypothetical protein
LLSETAAAVEIINLLLPTVAVVWFVDFAAVPLECHLVRAQEAAGDYWGRTAAEDGWGTGGSSRD